MDRSTLRESAGAAVLSGTSAALLSAGALAIAGKVKEDSALAPLNGPSQWLWGESEARTRRIDVAHTLVGYVIHHASALLWAGLFETLLARQPAPRSVPRVLGTAAGVTGLAYVVDYYVTPPRLRPGFEKHVGSASLFGVYAAVALGLAGAALWRQRRSKARATFDLDL